MLSLRQDLEPDRAPGCQSAHLRGGAAIVQHMQHITHNIQLLEHLMHACTTHSIWGETLKPCCLPCSGNDAIVHTQMFCHQQRTLWCNMRTSYMRLRWLNKMGELSDAGRCSPRRQAYVHKTLLTGGLHSSLHHKGHLHDLGT